MMEPTQVEVAEPNHPIHASISSDGVQAADESAPREFRAGRLLFRVPAPAARPRPLPRPICMCNCCVCSW